MLEDEPFLDRLIVIQGRHFRPAVCCSDDGILPKRLRQMACRGCLICPCGSLKRHRGRSLAPDDASDYLSLAKVTTSCDWVRKPKIDDVSREGNEEEASRSTTAKCNVLQIPVCLTARRRIRVTSKVVLVSVKREIWLLIGAK